MAWVWLVLAGLLIGKPLASSELSHERLSKKKALAIFSSDNLSSSAYATEEMLLVLILAGCFYTGNVNDKLPLGVVTLGSAHWHPLSLVYVANGCAMTSKTLRIPKL